MSIQIKNWDKFQHYQTGKNASKRPPWIKLYTELLDDIEFHRLDGKDAKALILLWALASESEGVLPSVQEIAFRLRLSEKEINSILGRLGHWLELPSYDVPRTDKEEEEDRDKIESGANAPPKRATQIPSGWHPKPETFVTLEAKGHSRAFIAAELEKFRDHHTAKGTLFKDWDAGLRSWMAKAREFAAGRDPPRQNVIQGSWRPKAFEPAKPEPKLTPEEIARREAQVARHLKKTTQSLTG